jgi:hypothetical protein
LILADEDLISSPSVWIAEVGGTEGFSYRGLALSLLAAFSVDETLASDPHFIATVPSLISLVHPRYALIIAHLSCHVVCSPSSSSSSTRQNQIAQ